MKIKWNYAAATLIVFVVELAIALFINDTVIRPYIGDTLAVILLYLAFRTVTPLKVLPSVGVALGIATVIELGQLLRIRDWLRLPDNALVSFTLGGFFDVKDLVAYAFGAVLVVICETLRRQPVI